MKLTQNSVSFAALTATLLFCITANSFASSAPIISGPIDDGQGEHLEIIFEPTGQGTGHWLVGTPENPLPLIADPKGSQMEKWFFTPTGEPLQPGWSAPVWENFLVWKGDTSFPPSRPITDWHEHIHEPGWGWEVPPVGTAGESLITRDGEPWEWKHIPPSGEEPFSPWLDVVFRPIEPGHILDIHKRLVWLGVEGKNTLWGDQKLDDGTPHEEVAIGVWEYPTVPEPTTLLLSSLATLVFCARRRRA